MEKPGFRTIGVFCLVMGLLFVPSEISKGAISLRVNGQDVSSVALEVGQSCSIEIVSNDDSEYDSWVGFEETEPLGTLDHTATMPEAGSDAMVTLLNEPPSFYGYEVVTGMGPLPGVQFVFQYEAVTVGGTVLQLWDIYPNVVDTITITVTEGPPAAQPLGTQFTYQGQLIDANEAANGLYDFEFKMFYDPCDTRTQVGDTIALNDVDVLDGYFTVELDFNDANSFNGDARWLEIGVRPGDLIDPNVYTTLTPRQEVTAAPYTFYAKTAENVFGGIVGGGTSNYVPKFLSSNSIGNSVIYESGGNVGIGMETPGAKLEVNGQVKITDGSQGTGKVLTSDSAGLATWQTPVTGDADWVISGNDMYSGVSGNVGIGTTSPDQKLTVADGTIKATNSVTTGRAVHGLASNNGGYTNYGGYFEAEGAWGRGIYGLSSGSDGRGVQGYASNSGNYLNFGGLFAAEGNLGRGVYGYASGGEGMGVFGYASHTSGANYGVYGKTDSPNGYAGYFVGGKNYFQGNVGIGEANPVSKLVVGQGGDILLKAAGEDAGDIIFQNSTGTQKARIYTGASTANELSLTTRGDSYPDIYIGGNGNVGIGTAIPFQKLQVEGAANGTFTALYLANTQAYGIGNDGNVKLAFGRPEGSGRIQGSIVVGSEYQADSSFGFMAFNTRLSGTESEKVRITSTGNVGIGTTNPGAKLEVNGQVKITGGSPAAGKVLTSDSVGLAAWTNLPAGGDITAVNAGTGLSGGGTSGDVTLDVSVPLSLTGLVHAPAAVIEATSTNSGYGVKGINIHSSDNGYLGGNGYGVYGSTYSHYGVYGESTNTQGTGVKGINSNGNYGELGTSGFGVYGVSYNGPAVCGTSSSGVGVYGQGGPSSYAAEFRGNVRICDRDSGSTVMLLGAGLDYAEGFDVSEEDGISPGTVLVIDRENPGKLAISRNAYDKKVAGIAAGAKGLTSGVRLGVEGFDCDVALAGRVYCNVDAAEFGIEAGDMLTTSDKVGYAMKAADAARSSGAILGKAMEPLEKGKKAQILVLVTLQ